MSSRESAAVAVDLAALESSAIVAGKKKAKPILAAIGEIEDMLQDVADMMKGA